MLVVGLDPNSPPDDAPARFGAGLTLNDPAGDFPMARDRGFPRVPVFVSSRCFLAAACASPGEWEKHSARRSRRPFLNLREHWSG
jgi:hypothetical protein